MGRQPKRKGISLGTVAMVAVTGLVALGCLWLFPKLLGNVELQLDASQLAVAIDSSLSILGDEADHTDTLDATALEPQTPQTPMVTQPQQASFSLTATGSIRINNAVQKALTDSSGYRFSILFEALKGEISSDVAIATLENIAISTEKLTDNNIPTDAVAAIASGGINCLSLGYDGVFDHGIAGLQATQESINAVGMTSYGVYANQQARSHPPVLTLNGVRVALLGYQNDLSNAGKKKLSRDEQSFALAQPTLPTIIADVQAAKTAGAQVIIASLSWGKAGASTPTDAQREMAQAIVDAGVDIILGTHSGIVQPIEILTAHREGGKTTQALCAYSLGNLFTYNRENRASISGVLLHATITYDLASGTVRIGDLAYSPTYVWRGKEGNKTLYRVLVSDVEPPHFVQQEQQEIMERSLALIQEVMASSSISLRIPNQVAPGR